MPPPRDTNSCNALTGVATARAIGERRELQPSSRARRTFLASVVGALGYIGAGAVRVAFAQEPEFGFRLITNLANPITTMDRAFANDVFLKKVTSWQGGEPIHPFDQGVGTQVRSKFSDAVLKRSAAAVRHYWQQRIFSGLGLPPPELESDEAVIRRIQRDHGAIGYVSNTADTRGVRVVTLR